MVEYWAVNPAAGVRFPPSTPNYGTLAERLCTGLLIRERNLNLGSTPRRPTKFPILSVSRLGWLVTPFGAEARKGTRRFESCLTDQSFRMPTAYIIPL